MAFESEPQDPVYLITQGTWVSLAGFPWQLTEIDAGAQARHPVWEIIGSIVDFG